MSKASIRAFAVCVLAATALTALSSPTPAAADIEEELAEARKELEEAQEIWAEAVEKLLRADYQLDALTEEIRSSKIRVERLEEESEIVGERLQERLVAAFKEGRVGSLSALLTADSFADFTDRLEFLANVAEQDLEAAVTAEQLAAEIRLTKDDLVAKQAELEQRVKDLAQLEAEAQEALEIAQGIFNSLEQTYSDQIEILDIIGQTPQPGAALERCPVAGLNSFVDSFGAPRSGGRTHAGTDLIAATGTPIVAAHSGFAESRWNILGGNAVYVTKPDGTFTYYAHMSEYGRLGPVETGDIIGYVGSTGNTTTPHLHFEYHPGGGSAINPYQLLLAVC